MSIENQTTITVMDKTFQVRCAPDEVELLHKAARFLDERMQKVRRSGVIGTERVAIMVALNLSYEFLALSDKFNQQDHVMQQVSRRLLSRISDAMIKAEQLPL